jgi:RecA-family ATPase
MNSGYVSGLSLDYYRTVDVQKILNEPRPEVAWRCEGVVADATLTILTGRGGDGKTWLAHALAAGVAKGSSVAGIRCKPGVALVVDAEMGAYMCVDRFRVAGIGSEVAVRDAMGFSVSNDEHMHTLRRDIEDIGAKFVVLDSFRRLTPGLDENASNDMGPAVVKVQRLARDTGAAIILIHHRGESDEKYYRGSTAIKDQTDAMLVMIRHGKGTQRRLTFEKGKDPRYAPLPEDRFIRVVPEQGGVIEASE